MNLYRCTRLMGTPRLTERACAQNRRRAEAARSKIDRMGIEACVGCCGVRELFEPEELDPGSITPVSEVTNRAPKRGRVTMQKRLEDLARQRRKVRTEVHPWR